VAANLTKEQRAEARRKACSLRQRGWTEQRIADHLSLNQSTISRYLDQLTRKAVANLDARINREFLATLGIYDHTVDEALQAWERSKKPKRKASKRSGGAKGDGSSAESTTAETTERDGDPAFLTLALSASDRKRQLLALDERFAPPKADDDQVDGGASGMTVAEAILRQAEARDESFESDEAPGDAPTDEPDRTSPSTES
jgi:predicted transcriptional regulator